METSGRRRLIRRYSLTIGASRTTRLRLERVGSPMVAMGMVGLDLGGISSLILYVPKLNGIISRTYSFIKYYFHLSLPLSNVELEINTQKPQRRCTDSHTQS